MSFQDDLYTTKAEVSNSEIPWQNAAKTTGHYLWRIIELLHLDTRTNGWMLLLTKQVVACMSADCNLQVGSMVKESLASNTQKFGAQEAIKMNMGRFYGYVSVEDINLALSNRAIPWYKVVEKSQGTNPLFNPSFGRDILFEQTVTYITQAKKSDGKEVFARDEATGEMKAQQVSFCNTTFIRLWQGSELAGLPDAGVGANQLLTEGTREDRGLPHYEALPAAQEIAPVAIVAPVAQPVAVAAPVPVAVAPPVAAAPPVAVAPPVAAPVPAAVAPAPMPPS